MRSLGSVLLVVVAASVAASIAACDSDKDRPPAAGGCQPGVPCNPLPGSSGGGGDAGSDAAAADATGDADPDASSSVTGFVRRIRTSFTEEPSATAEAAAGVTVAALQLGGGTVQALSAADGSFTLSPILANVGEATWFDVAQSGLVRSHAGVAVPSTAPIQLPFYDETLVVTTANRVPGLVLPANPVTVVVHVYDGNTSGNPRLAGVSSQPIGLAAKPYYDDGLDVTGLPTATGARGTIVFMGGDASTNPYPVTLSYGGKSRGTVSVPVKAGAVSWIAVLVDTTP